MNTETTLFDGLQSYCPMLSDIEKQLQRMRQSTLPMLISCLAPLAITTIVLVPATAEAQMPEQSEIEERLGSSQWTKSQRDAWFDRHLKGRAVKWTGKVMSVQEQTYGGVVVDMLRPSPQASFDCVISEGRRYFERYALTLTAGQHATCNGEISSYLRLYGVVRLRIQARSLDRAKTQ